MFVKDHYINSYSTAPFITPFIAPFIAIWLLFLLTHANCTGIIRDGVPGS